MLEALVSQFLRYASVGLVAAVFHYGTLILCVEAGWLEPYEGALAGFVAGGIVSYGLNHRYTFSTDRSHMGTVPRFAAIAVVAFLLTGFLMHWMTERLGIHYLLAQAVTTGIVLVWTFIANRFWTFGEPVGR